MSTTAALAALSCALAATAADAAPLLRFDDALETIVRRSTAVAIQGTNVDAAQARALPSRAAFAPSLSIVGSETKYRSGGVTDPGFIASGTRSAQLQASLNLFHFGADLANWHAATADEDAQKEQLAAAVLRAEDSGVQLLVTSIQRELETDVLRKLAESRKRLATIGRQRFDRGLLPLQEARKLEIDLANAEARLKDGLIQAETARANLASALGEGQIGSEWPWLARFGAGAAWTADALKLDRLPAWRAAQNQVAAEDDRESRNLRLMLPSLDASGAYGYTNTYNNNGPMQLGYTGTLSLTVPLFDHLSNYSAYRAQLATRRSAELTLEQTERDARAEFVSASATFRNAYESSKNRSRTAELARRLFDDNLRRFQSGRATADELAIDEQRLFDAELLDVDGWSATHLAFARLCHASGRRLGECFSSSR